MRTKICFILSFIVIFLLRFGSVEAQPTITIKSKNDLIFVQKELYYFIDTTDHLTIKEIAAPAYQQKFQQNLQDVFQSRLRKNHWFRLSIQNKSQQTAWIDLSSSFLGKIDYYVPTPNGYQLHTQTGTLRPMNAKAFPTNTFWLPLGEQDSTQTIYFCVTSWRNIELPIYAGGTDALVQQKTIQDFIAAAFMGLGLMLIFYNLSLFFVIRDSVYLWYSGYIFWAINLFAFLNHYPYFTHFLSEEARIWFNTKTVYWGSPLNFFVAGFGIQFLGLRKKTPLVYYWLLVLTFTIVVLVPLSSYFNILRSFTVIKVNLFLLLQLSLFVTGIYLWLFKKEKNARFYVIAWFWLFLSSLFYVFVTGSYLPYNYFTRNANFWGLSLEVLFFSLALGDRIVFLRKEKEDAQAKNIRLIQEQNTVLEQKVTERTLEIQHQKEAIEKQNLGIRQNINYARRIQAAFLPKEETIKQYIDEFFVFFRPRDVVSGDFYFVEEVQGKVIVAAIDCTGHGVSGAFMTMLGNEILRNLVDNQFITSPDILLNELHKGVRIALKQQDTDNKDGMDLSVIVIDKAQKQVEFAGAKNPAIYIQNGELFVLKADKMPIGGEQREQERIFTKTTIDISQSTTFYLFSDGYQDQFGGENDKKFMLATMKKMFLDIMHLPINEQEQIVATTFDKWKTGREQTDDVLVLGLRV